MHVKIAWLSDDLEPTFYFHENENKELKNTPVFLGKPVLKRLIGIQR